MTPTRIALAAGIAFLAAFVVVAAVAIHAVAAVAVVLVIAGLVACGNLLYGRHSHGATAQARVRPAQEARNRAAAVAADARRAVAEADRRGERYCPLDPVARQGARAPVQHLSPDPVQVPTPPDTGTGTAT